MDLIDKEDAWNKLCNTLVNISINDFVDFPSKFISDLCFLWFHNLSHQAHEIITSLWLCIGHIEIVKSDILDDFLLLMNISLWQRNILFGLQIIFAGICVTSSDSLDISC